MSTPSHVPLASLGSPGLPISSYDQLYRHRPDPPWPPDPAPPSQPRRPRGLLRRLARLRPAVAVGTR